MSNPTRILFVSDDVAPFTQASEIAELVRTLPDQLQETGNFEVRIMMPRYGTISERRNRLHEVIRLSGTDVEMGDRTETLKVKVASIPGIRLQVYFMDNSHYFKRKGVYGDKSGKAFADNPERALFFGRAALETIRNLGWGPDVVHGLGSLSAVLPFLLRTEFADEPLYENARTVFSPSSLVAAGSFTAEKMKTLGLPVDERMLDRSLSEVGAAYADAVVYPSALTPEVPDAVHLSEDAEAALGQVTDLYLQLVESEVPA